MDVNIKIGLNYIECVCVCVDWLFFWLRTGSSEGLLWIPHKRRGTSSTAKRLSSSQDLCSV